MFKHYCLLCDARATDRDLCDPCRADLPWLGPACARCARPLRHPTRGAWCGRCLRRPPLQAATRAALRYEFPVDQLLQKLKFGHALPPGRVLGELLAESIRGAPGWSRRKGAAPTTSGPGIRVDVLVPVPLHAKRLRERGFNQAVEIARPVGRALGLPVLTRACRRTRDTPPQSTLDARERRRNPKGAFTADAAVAGLRVAVIDDVYTSGSTVAAVTHALLHAGAARVEAWCVARAGVR